MTSLLQACDNSSTSLWQAFYKLVASLLQAVLYQLISFCIVFNTYEQSNVNWVLIIYLVLDCVPIWILFNPDWTYILNIINIELWVILFENNINKIRVYQICKPYWINLVPLCLFHNNINMLLVFEVKHMKCFFFGLLYQELK